MGKSGFAVRMGLILVFIFAADSSGKYSGGAGTQADPFRISTVSDWQELMATPADWASHFVLTGDIDLNDVYITPIAPDTSTTYGFQGTQFTGVFNGNGHIIRNADMNMPDVEYVGLFGYVGQNGQIRNVGVEDAEIAGGDYVGGLVGWNCAAVTNCYSTGSVTGGTDIGGLVGNNDESGPFEDNEVGIVTNCYAIAKVKGDYGIGGLVGHNARGGISNCYSASSASGYGGVGGLVGYFESGSISRSYFLHPDDGGGPDNGLGLPLADIEMRQQRTFVGWDFVGQSFDGTCEIWQIPAAGTYPDLSTFRGYTPPVLAGEGSRRNPYLISDANEFGAIYYHDPVASYQLAADIDLYGMTWSTPPMVVFSGVFDGNDHVIRNLDVNMRDGDHVGVFGYVRSGADIRSVGVEDSTIVGRYRVGGLVGQSGFGRVTSCWASGTVSGRRYVGGLAGYSDASIIDCYAICSVSGENQVGGLVGEDSGHIVRCYAAGLVSGGRDAGGLVGLGLLGSTSRSYFLQLDDGGGPDNGVGSPLTDLELRQQVSFDGWDFAGESANGTGEAWQMPIGGGYPVLSSFNGYVPPMLAGTGTPDSPYLISDANELGAVYHYNRAFCYRLKADICLAGITWSIAPIPVFHGSFDGNDCVICDLDVNMPNGCHGGLFGYVGSGSDIHNLGIEDAEIVGRRDIGGLVGYNEGGRITNCYTVCSVNGKDWVGGLAGVNISGDVTNCYATGSVKGIDYIGGLVGSNSFANITACHARGAVDGDGEYYIGGLVGSNAYGHITDCYATGPVNGKGSSAGGLVGVNTDGDITNCYATSSVCGDERVGGLVAYNSYGATISNCCATGSVSGDRYVGGLVGYNIAIVSNCKATGSVGGNDRVGGLVGLSDHYYARITNCYSAGSISGDLYVGGLVGYQYRGRISYCYATGLTEGDRDVGGLVGRSSLNAITSSYFLHPDDGGGPDNDRGETLMDIGMRQEGSFVGWDFVGESANGMEDIWSINEGVDYPRLWWEDCSMTSGLEFGDFTTVEKTRIGRTSFRYVLSLEVRNTTDSDLTDIWLTLFSSSAQVTGIIDGQMILPVIEAHATIDTSTFEEYFIIEVDRAVNIAPGSFGWQVPCSGADSASCKVMLMCIPSEAAEIRDFTQLSELWLWTGSPGGIAEDVVPDGVVNFADFATLCWEWLRGR